MSLFRTVLTCTAFALAAAASVPAHADTYTLDCRQQFESYDLHLNFTLSFDADAFFYSYTASPIGSEGFVSGRQSGGGMMQELGIGRYSLQSWNRDLQAEINTRDGRNAVAMVTFPGSAPISMPCAMEKQVDPNHRPCQRRNPRCR